MTSHSPSDPPPALQSRFTKHHSKSDTSQHLQTMISSTDRVTECHERIDLLERSLDDALKENKRLLAELKNKREIESQLEDEKSLTAVLSLITEAVQPPE